VAHIVKYRDCTLYVVSCAKTAEPIEMSFGLLARVDPGTHVLGGMHIGATWRTRLNRPCVAAMRPFVKLVLSVVLNIESNSYLASCFVPLFHRSPLTAVPTRSYAVYSSRCVLPYDAL